MLISMSSYTALHFLHRGFVDVELAPFRDAFTTRHIIQTLSFSLLLLRCLFPHSTRCYSQIFIFLARPLPTSFLFRLLRRLPLPDFLAFAPVHRYLVFRLFATPISHTFPLTPSMYSISSLLFAITLSFADRSIVLSLRKINYRLFIPPV